MNPERGVESLDGREQALLQRGDYQIRCRLLTSARTFQSFLPQRPVLVQKSHQCQIRRIIRQSGNVVLNNFPLRQFQARNRFVEFILQPPDHHLVE